jgi:predicted lipoprotein with Yx(FWY)xxD motif
MFPTRYMIPMLAAAALALGACGGGNGNTKTASTDRPTTASGGRAATVGVANDSALGKILVDSRGRTLYLFKKDTGTQSQCSGACAAAWPPVRAAAKPTAGSGVTASKLGTSARSDGAPQVTYNGHPLYLYAGDQNPGDTNGQGITGFGAAWYVVSPSGDQITSGGSGNGY